MADRPLSVEYRATDGLVPFERNARIHSEEQVAQIAASILEFGWTNPVLLADGGGIIAGHGRVLAARKLGMAEVPTITLAGLTDEQRRALVIADNKLALNAGWDDELLALELGELREVGYDIGLVGFSDMELEAILAPKGGGLTDPEVAPEPPVDPASKIGDVWLLGRHRIVCGDSTDAATVAKALNGVEPHLMVTDPPYGVEYDANWRNDQVQAGKSARGAPRGRAVGRVENDDKADWHEAWALFPGDVAYVWCASMTNDTVIWSLEDSGLERRAQIVWRKNNIAIARPLSLAARSLLVRRPQGAHRTLGRRPQAIDRLGHRQAAQIRDRPLDAEARRVHAPADREQLLAGAGGLRALQRLRHHDHRGRDDGPRLPRDRVEPGLCRRRGDPLAGVHRQGRDARRGWPDLRRYQQGPSESRQEEGGTGASRGRIGMAVRGRKPKPTHLRLVGGNAGKRPIKANEPKPEVAAPQPPPHLNEAAKAEWGRIVGQLLALRLVTELDRAALAAYCVAYARWAEAEEHIGHRLGPLGRRGRDRRRAACPERRAPPPEGSRGRAGPRPPLGPRGGDPRDRVLPRRAAARRRAVRGAAVRRCTRARRSASARSSAGSAPTARAGSAAPSIEEARATASRRSPGIGHYCLLADKEPRAEVYAAAANKDQAMVLFRDAVAMRRAVAGARRRLTPSGGNPVWNLADLEDRLVLPADLERGAEIGQSGPRPSCALCDEVHEHPDGLMIEMLERGFKWRRQPLLVMTTNSGSDRNSVCWQEHQHAVRVAAGTRTPDEEATFVGEPIDDETFAFVCSLDPDDDPLEDPAAGKRRTRCSASRQPDYLAGVVRQAKAIPGKLNGILRLHFCQWTDADSAWMSRAGARGGARRFRPEEHAARRSIGRRRPVGDRAT
jgi:hypothetical protein